VFLAGDGGGRAGRKWMSDPCARLRGMRKLHMPHIQISHAALRLYAAKGPQGLTMRGLGKALGVCASALYRHFRNKDAIVETVVEAADSQLAFRLRRSPRLQPSDDRAGFLAERAMLFSLEQPHLFQLLIRRRAVRHGDNGGERAILMRTELTKAMNDNQLRQDDVDGVTRAVWAQICGLVALKERGDLPAAEQPLREAWVGAAQRMLQGLRAA
jgi:AcrR family transcriptional regulator